AGRGEDAPLVEIAARDLTERERFDDLRSIVARVLRLPLSGARCLIGQIHRALLLENLLSIPTEASMLGATRPRAAADALNARRQSFHERRVCPAYCAPIKSVRAS